MTDWLDSLVCFSLDRSFRVTVRPLCEITKFLLLWDAAQARACQTKLENEWLIHIIKISLVSRREPGWGYSSEFLDAHSRPCFSCCFQSRRKLQRQRWFCLYYTCEDQPAQHLQTNQRKNGNPSASSTNKESEKHTIFKFFFCSLKKPRYQF
jgi:hypothetical protein